MPSPNHATERPADELRLDRQRTTQPPPDAPSGPLSHAVAPRGALLWGGLAWVLATLQYAVAQLVAAAAWNPPYNWFNNYISALGNTDCGTFAVPHGAPAYVCSPLHPLMNASFIVAGILTITGAALLNHTYGLPGDSPPAR